MPRLWYLVCILLISCPAIASVITDKIVGIADGDSFTLLLVNNTTVRIRLLGIPSIKACKCAVFLADTPTSILSLKRKNLSKWSYQTRLKYWHQMKGGHRHKAKWTLFKMPMKSCCHLWFIKSDLQLPSGETKIIKVLLKLQNHYWIFGLIRNI